MCRLTSAQEKKKKTKVYLEEQGVKIKNIKCHLGNKKSLKPIKSDLNSEGEEEEEEEEEEEKRKNQTHV